LPSCADEAGAEADVEDEVDADFEANEGDTLISVIKIENKEKRFQEEIIEKSLHVKVKVG